jgi:branched-subunit amino acid aminotransferase/4-amino-4-deoxychorismate lyase
VSGARAWTLVEGSFREGADVPVADRGFRYGMSVFETFAVRGGRILFLEQHLAALECACEAAGFRFRKVDSLGNLGALPDGLLRIYVTAGDGISPRAESGHHTFAFFEPAEFPNAEDVARGARVSLQRAPIQPVLGGWKTGNYWQNIMALTTARENGFDETLIVNIRGVVISAAMANVFFVMNGVLQTPAAEAGARHGIVKGWVEEMTSVAETLPSPKDVNEAEECFLTNSRLGVMPVSEIDGRCLPSRKTGEALAALYGERILQG